MQPWPSANSPPDLVLSPDRVDLWFVFTDQEAAPELAARYRALLTEQERGQQQRFYFARDRHRYLLTRALVRTVLSRYAPIAAADWRFEPSAYGKPMIVNDHDAVRRLSFNISHTEGLIVLAVTADRAVGVDTERTQRDIALEIADRYFSPSEVAALYALPAELQRGRFLELWTLKESYIKARGIGLSIPLGKFSFNLDGEGEAIRFDAELGDSPAHWRFYQMRPSDTHTAALCLQRHPAQMPNLTSRQLVPLVAEQLIDFPVSILGAA
ncbi:4'-phosphopantetheinyl transferase family protein [uncultured Bradyrhizobium sp.]|uniref:4'-phosphopantetheinyl transferase family protein n=1 Tax=uncultured Bradyrhizobium sp. TaxID=199684 RepID=UPI0035C9EBCD